MMENIGGMEIEHQDLSYEIYKKLKHMIVSNQLTPGTKLKQEQLAESFGVSRMPLYKAFQMLEDELLVENRPRRGYYVTEVDDTQLKDAFECREVIEGLAVRDLAETATPEEIETLKNIFAKFEGQTKIDVMDYLDADQEFHHKIMKMCRNQFISKFEMLSIYTFRTYRKGLLRSPEVTINEHMRIIDAIEARNGTKAEDLMRKHLYTSRSTLQ